MERQPPFTTDELLWPEGCVEERHRLLIEDPVFTDAKHFQEQLRELSFDNPFVATQAAREVCGRLDQQAQSLMGETSTLYGPDIFERRFTLSDDPDAPGTVQRNARIPMGEVVGSSHHLNAQFFGFTHYIEPQERADGHNFAPQLCYALCYAVNHNLPLDDPSLYGGRVMLFGKVETTKLQFWADELHQQSKDSLESLFTILPEEKYEKIAHYSGLLTSDKVWTPRRLQRLHESSLQLTADLDESSRYKVQAELCRLAERWLVSSRGAVEIEGGPVTIRQRGSRQYMANDVHEGHILGLSFIDDPVVRRGDVQMAAATGRHYLSFAYESHRQQDEGAVFYLPLINANRMRIISQ